MLLIITRWPTLQEIFMVGQGSCGTTRKAENCEKYEVKTKMSGSALNTEVVAMITKHDAEKELMHQTFGDG